MAVEKLFDGIQSWQAVLGLLGSGFGVGTFAHWLLVRLLYGENFDKLKHEVEKLENKNAQLSIEVGEKSTALNDCSAHRKELMVRLTKHEAIREALLADEEELWQLHPALPPKGYFAKLGDSKTKIISIANHKGGVGKTTVTANLAAYLEKRLDKRVLAIDLDYQGSLSATLLRMVNLDYVGSVAEDLIGGDFSGAQACQVARTLQPRLPKTSVITANYELYKFENRLMLKWLLDEVEHDVRFNLGEVLLSPEIQERFDVVLIDTPPRLTTAAINAFCASHHVIIPTIPDPLSSESVGRFAKQIKGLQGALNPALNLAGVVVNFSFVNVLQDREKDALLRIRKDFENMQINAPILERNIPRLAALAGVAGEDVAYLNDKMFREGIMNKLGDEIAERIGFRVPG
ncbi:MAG: ParA family protein [Filomicrobium sp.]